MIEWRKIQKYTNHSASSEGEIRNDITGKILKKKNHAGPNIPEYSYDLVSVEDLAIIEAESISQLAVILGRNQSTAQEALVKGNRCAGYRIYSML